MNIENQYLELLKDILQNGVKKGDRTGTGTLSVFGRQIRHNMSEGFPLLTTKKMYFKGIVTELLWFLRGDTNIKYLVDNDCHIWDGDAYKNFCKERLQIHEKLVRENSTYDFQPWEETVSKEIFIDNIKNDIKFSKKWGDLGPIYGKQWRRWGNEIIESPTNETWEEIGIDQIQNLINDLVNNPDSRRLLVNAWNVSEIDKAVLPPCHYGFQCWTRELTLVERNTIAPFNGELIDSSEEEILEWYDKIGIPKRAISLMWNQRSCDFFLGIPFNIASYALLLEIIAKEVNMIPDELIGNLGDTHLYLNHIEQAKEQIERIPYKLPTLRIVEDYLGCFALDFSKKINMMKNSFFILDDYQSHPSIKAPLSN